MAPFPLHYSPPLDPHSSVLELMAAAALTTFSSLHVRVHIQAVQLLLPVPGTRPP